MNKGIRNDDEPPLPSQPVECENKNAVKALTTVNSMIMKLNSLPTTMKKLNQGNVNACKRCGEILADKVKVRAAFYFRTFKNEKFGCSSNSYF